MMNLEGDGSIEPNHLRGYRTQQLPVAGIATFRRFGDEHVVGGEGPGEGDANRTPERSRILDLSVGDRARKRFSGRNDAGRVGARLGVECANGQLAGDGGIEFAGEDSMVWLHQSGPGCDEVPKGSGAGDDLKDLNRRHGNQEFDTGRDTFGLEQGRSCEDVTKRGTVVASKNNLANRRSRSIPNGPDLPLGVHYQRIDGG